MIMQRDEDNLCSRETRVFFPVNGRFGRRDTTWQNVCGYLIRPLVQLPYVRWFWFSRYALGINDPDLQDCDPDGWHEEFYWSVADQRGLLSFRLRYSLPSDCCADFETKAAQLFANHSVIPRYFRNYSVTGDLGNERHTTDESQRAPRAQIVARMVHATSQLVLHGLRGPNALGDFEFESIAFDVPHHLVSNITGKPG